MTNLARNVFTLFYKNPLKFKFYIISSLKLFSIICETIFQQSFHFKIHIFGMEIVYRTGTFINDRVKIKFITRKCYIKISYKLNLRRNADKNFHIFKQPTHIY